MKTGIKRVPTQVDEISVVDIDEYSGGKEELNQNMNAKY